MKKLGLKMHWTFFVLYLVFAVLLTPAVMWLVALNSGGSCWLTGLVGLLLCFVIPTGFRICELCAYYPAIK